MPRRSHFINSSFNKCPYLYISIDIDNTVALLEFPLWPHSHISRAYLSTPMKINGTLDVFLSQKLATYARLSIIMLINA